MGATEVHRRERGGIWRSHKVTADQSLRMNLPGSLAWRSSVSGTIYSTNFTGIAGVV